MFSVIPNRHDSRSVSRISSESPSASPRPAKRQCLSSEANEMSGYYPKRTPKACDRCRLKKARCQWSLGKICEKCNRDGVVCTSNRDSKRKPPKANAEYVQLVEAQRDSLLGAIGQMLEDGLVNDQTAIARTLHEFGIQAAALRRASQLETELEHGTTVDETDPCQIATVILPLRRERSLEGATPEDDTDTIALGTGDGTLEHSYFDLPPHWELERDLWHDLTNLTTEATSALVVTSSPSGYTNDWFVTDQSCGGWQLPSAPPQTNSILA